MYNIQRWNIGKVGRKMESVMWGNWKWNLNWMCAENKAMVLKLEDETYMNEARFVDYN